MNRELINKCLKYISGGFIIVITLELVFFFIFSLNVELHLGTYNINIITLITTSGLVSFHNILEWILLLITISGFLVLEISLLIVSIRKNIDNALFAKYIFFSGILFLIAGFVKFFSIYSLANSVIYYDSSSIIFQSALYNELITPFIGAVMWIYFSSVTMAILTSGLIFGGFGLKAIQKIEQSVN